MKKVGLAIFMALIALGLKAQRVEWKPNGLTWADFKAVPQTSVPYQSDLSYFVGFDASKEAINDTVLRRYQVYTYVDAQQSWAKRNGKTVEQLKYNQVVFDLVELYKRKIQQALDKAETPDAVKAQFNTIGQECRLRVFEFKAQSEFGAKAAVVNQWAQETASQLSSLSTKAIPVHTKHWFGYGLEGGLGYATTTSGLSDYYNGFPFVTGGVELAIGKPVISFNGQFGIADFLKEYREGMAAVYEGIKVTLLMANMWLAYPVVDGSKHKLSPFVGIGVTTISNASGGGNTENRRLKPFAWNPVAGLTYDYKFSRVLKLTFDQLLTDTKESVEGSFRLKIFVAQNEFSPEFKGQTINLSLGFAGFSRKVKVD